MIITLYYKDTCIYQLDTKGIIYRELLIRLFDYLQHLNTLIHFQGKKWSVIIN